VNNVKIDPGAMEFEPLSHKLAYGLIKKDIGLEECFNHSSLESMFASISMIKQEKSRYVFVGELRSGKKIFCKMYRERGLVAFFRRSLFKSRAERAHARTAVFQGTGALTPPSLGYMVRRNGYFGIDAYHFGEYFSTGIALSTLAENVLPKQDRQAEWLAQLAIQLGSIHAEGFVHGDTKLSNFLFVKPKVYVVDLDGFQRASNRKSPARDIARLLVALSEAGVPEDQLAFFVTSYCKYLRIDKITLIDRVQPIVIDFQRKHEKKYGRTPKALHLR
jgi:hypothetical protein